MPVPVGNDVRTPPVATGETEQTTAPVEQTAAPVQGGAEGTGCASIKEKPTRAKRTAGILAKYDALRKVCAGGKEGVPVSGRAFGSIERYFVNDEGRQCASGNFQIICETPEPAVKK